MSLKRIVALFKKELRDTLRNPSVVLIYTMPLLLSILWNNLLQDIPSQVTAIIGILFAVVMIGVYQPSMMLAEEKEAKTLRVLRLSPAKPLEIVAAKGFATLIVIVVVCQAVLFISSAPVPQPLLLWTLILTSSVFSIFLGFIIGMLAPNQIATGYIGLPAYLVLLMIPIFAQTSHSLKGIAQYIPTEHLGNGIQAAIQGKGFGDTTLEVAVLAGTAIAMVAIFLYTYRRTELNN